MQKPANNYLTHIGALRTALRQEYEYERAYFQQQQESRGLSRLTARGECWWPICIEQVGHNLSGNMTITLRRESEVESETRCQFEPGTAVSFFCEKEHHELQHFRWSAQVSLIDANRMVVILPTPGCYSDLHHAEGKVGVQLAFNERTYQLQFEALNHLEKTQNSRTLHLMEVLIGMKKPVFKPLSRIGMQWLNPSQEEAVNRALCAEDVMIVHGPPGTGKTTTLVEAIYETLRRESQVMVCAQSNAAVDWIASLLLDRGVPVLRIGNPIRVTDRLLACTYERQFQDHPKYHELWSLRKAMGESKHNHQQRDRLRERINGLELEIRQSLFLNSKVIACTLAGAGHPVLSGQQFHSVFIDEAGQATEPACWVAIRKAGRVILAGDHCQLPPTIKSPEAARGLLSRTLMERVALQKPEAVSLLTMQYRMHPDIMRFSSQWFYDNQLTAAPQVGFRSALDYDSAMIWFDTTGAEWPEAEQTDGTSRYNTEEARFLVQQLEEYVDMMAARRIQDEHIDFGIISPYQAQIQILRRLIKQSQKLRSIRRYITVETVDAFQGQERDVILISLVRANEQGQIGFLSDLRRMNVAITRARHKVLIVGDRQTLSRHRFYRELADYIESVGRVVEVQPTSDGDATSLQTD